MRIFYFLICLTVLAAGALFGALNAEPVIIDFYAWATELRLGLALLLAALLGAVLGGVCVWAGVVVPLRHRLSRQQRDSRSLSTAKASESRGELTE